MCSRASVGLETSADSCEFFCGGQPTIFSLSPRVLGPWLGHCAGPTSCLPQSPPFPQAPVCEVPGDQGTQWLLYSLEGRHFTLGGLLQGGREQPCRCSGPEMPHHSSCPVLGSAVVSLVESLGSPALLRGPPTASPRDLLPYSRDSLRASC